MAKILLAASPKAREVLERILSGHEFICAETVGQGEHSLARQRCDLIVCTVVFDDSRMFEFLQVVKASEAWRDIPFVCARVRPNVAFSPVALEAVRFTCRTLGAEAFLDIEDYKVVPEREMRNALEQFLKPPARPQTHG
jgi:hypothetical protein